MTLLLALFLATPVIRYATATSHVGAHGHTSLYSAPALFDGDDRTAWCEGRNGLGISERVGLEFARPVVVDRIRIALGDSKDFGGFGPANRPRVITLHNMKYTWQVIMPDSAEAFEMPLPPAFRGEQMTVRIDEVYNHGGRHTCFAELTLFEGKEPLQLVRPAKGTTAAAPDGPSLEGAWSKPWGRDPEAFLVMYRDGRFQQWTATNAAPERKAAAAGTWKLAGNEVEFGVDRRTFRSELTLAPPEDGRPVIILSGPYAAGTWAPWVPDVAF